MKLAVLVSGGGTNLQAIIDSIESGTITNAEIAVVISNNPNAYALERAKAHHIEAKCVSPKSYESREAFNQALLEAIQSYQVQMRQRRQIQQRLMREPLNSQIPE